MRDSCFEKRLAAAWSIVIIVVLCGKQTGFFSCLARYMLSSHLQMWLVGIRDTVAMVLLLKPLRESASRSECSPHDPFVPTVPSLELVVRLWLLLLLLLLLYSRLTLSSFVRLCVPLGVPLVMRQQDNTTTLCASSFKNTRRKRS